VLAIGLVVDDAIVVLENIYRHIEEGLEPFQAAIKGIREKGLFVGIVLVKSAAVDARGFGDVGHGKVGVLLLAAQFEQCRLHAGASSRNSGIHVGPS
jgi:hypothetical protein